MKRIDEFLEQRPSGQWPTLMYNRDEGKIKPVDTLAITSMVIYLTQMRKQKIVDTPAINLALDFIMSKSYQSEIEGYLVWHFNSFYPPDWEDTAMAVYILWQNGRLDLSQLEYLRKLLINNTPQQGTGVWVKDPYSKNNANQNHWDPTTGINVLRLHYLLGVDKQIITRLEDFVVRNLDLENFGKNTLYYTLALSAFFAKRLLVDFPESTNRIAKHLEFFYSDVISAIYNKRVEASCFERVLLNVDCDFPKYDSGLIFHHGGRNTIWYGSPKLYQIMISNL